MIRIGIDARAIFTPSLTGIERVVLRLLELWPKHDPELVAYTNKNKAYHFPSTRLVVIPPRQNAVWFHLSLPFRIWKDKIDVFVSPITQFPALLPPSVTKVVVVYDLAYVHFPDLYDPSDLKLLRGRVERSIRNADGIITISESSKKDLQETYAIDPSNISVCYPAADANQETEELPIDLSQYPQYVLTVGTAYGRKNLSIIPPVLKILKEQYNLRLHVMMTGKRGFRENQVLDDAKALGVYRNITHLGYVTDGQRASLMKHASVFFLPSLYEGFGIPVLEAFLQRCPVVCSNTSSLPEVGGSAVKYFNPHNPLSAAQALAEVLTDVSLRNQLMQYGIEQAKKFSWKQMTQSIRQALITFNEKKHAHRT